MLVNFNALSDSTIHALDGDIGQIKDVYFDDRYWTIRFLVVDIKPWVPLSKKTLISPIALLEFDAEIQLLNLSITRDKVKNSPQIEEHETVSRQFERSYFDYYAYGYYWVGPGTWGEYAYPMALDSRHTLLKDSEKIDDTQTTNHLRSAKEIIHYGIDAVDGKKGYIKDLIWDTYNWTLRYLVVDTRDWLPGGKKVLISPEQLASLNWQDKTVTCTLDLEQIKSCPQYQIEKLNDAGYLKEVNAQLMFNK
ncbi:PRC-barrel domain containing protein [Colwellia hornerae]|uniref:PRC-barrel domain containing protein n=1 Tax=Colwellia hornerae TaxID=89402 RepID=A0A5C6Q3Q7_9GAMM|nr:PRC-barrel domain containing protein [Colwellia hornerae]TWX47185.1 PRC-barrel domain containing protein [Colwellia hornerae]TWX54487.1 PRC-barrel domain containing protein [Colwellia hornerae]TWX63267.1 PRC-barrel domain containing protein [Colwellia hornerae]